jgi:hypothetical protein
LLHQLHAQERRRALAISIALRSPFGRFLAATFFPLARNILHPFLSALSHGAHRPLAERYVEGLFLTVAEDTEREFVSRFVTGDHIEEGVGPVHVLIVNADDFVAGSNAGARRRTIRGYVANEHAARFLAGRLSRHDSKKPLSGASLCGGTVGALWRVRVSEQRCEKQGS